MSQYYNPYIIIPLITWAVAQFVKFLIKAATGDFNLRYLYTSGGMPSVHSAAICALAVTAWAYAGFTSAAFGISAVLAAVVMYDSFGVRRAAGDQAVAINDILGSLGKRPDLEHTQLREVLGHRPSEVISGAATGILVSILLTFNRWENKLELLTNPPTSTERLAYLIMGIIAVVAAAKVAYWFGKQRLGKAKNLKGVGQFAVSSLLGFGGLSLVASLLQYQQINVGEWRLWSLLVLGIAALVFALSWYYWLRFVMGRIRRELSGKKPL